MRTLASPQRWFWTVAVMTMTAAKGYGAPTPTALGFEQAIDMAVAASLERKMAESELDAQTARHRQAQADYGPRVDVVGTAADFDKPAQIALGGAVFVVRPEQYRDATLSIKQPLTGLYSVWQHSGMEKTQEEIAKLDVEIKRIDAAFSAAEAYRRVQEAQEKEKIAEASITSTESQARDARDLVETGRIIKSDLLKIEISTHEAKAALAHAVADKRKALAQLAYLVKVADLNSISVEPLPSARDNMHAVSEASNALINQTADLGTTLKQAEDARLDMKQANLRVEKADYARRLTDWRFAPEVNAAVSWERIYDTPPFGSPPFTRTFSLQATWEIWDNGSRVYAHHEAAANAQKAATAVQDAQDHLRLQLQSILADLQAAKETLAAAQASVTQAEEAYRLDKARFSTGLVTATDLVISETSQTRARGALVAALTDVDLLNLMTQKAMGETRPRAVLH